MESKLRKIFVIFRGDARPMLARILGTVHAIVAPATRVSGLEGACAIARTVCPSRPMSCQVCPASALR